jgi:AcrR family transcriptional regulator
MPRGRPRTSDEEEEEEEVRTSIMRLFWEKGYSARTLTDLSVATGLSRPSLYAASGNKIEMYLSSMRPPWTCTSRP